MRHLVSLLLVTLVQPVAAKELVTVSPESVGLSSERLSRIETVMKGHIDSGRFPGAVALIERKGKIAYLEHWGTTTPESIFRLYSMTKPVISVAVMMLHEEGRFLLSDPVSKFIPELAEPEVLVEVDMGSLDETRSIAESAHREITIRDLLRHTSGYTYGMFDDSTVDELYRQKNVLDFTEPLAEMVDKLGELPLKYQPGTVWNYSVSTDVLARLIEVVSEKPVDVFLHERLLGPLAMVDTEFGVVDTNRERLALLYRDGAPARGGFDIGERQALLSGGAGLVSTVADYLRFCRMLMYQGELDGTRILSRKSVEAMTSDQLGDIDHGSLREGYGFGLGFAVATDVGRMGRLGSVGEFYWGGLAGTTFFVDPAEEMIGIFMIQNLNDFVPRDQFKALAYQAIID
jgi:CubicO group peptidase (beta-lactamase class C family)